MGAEEKWNQRRNGTRGGTRGEEECAMEVEWQLVEEQRQKRNECWRSSKGWRRSGSRGGVEAEEEWVTEEE